MNNSIMSDEEILRAAQAENHHQENDEYERSIINKSMAVGTIAGMILCFTLMILELIEGKGIDAGKPAILLTLCGISDFYIGKKLSIKKKLIIGIVDLVIAILMIICFIGEMM